MNARELMEKIEITEMRIGPGAPPPRPELVFKLPPEFRPAWEHTSCTRIRAVLLRTDYVDLDNRQASVLNPGIKDDIHRRLKRGLVQELFDGPEQALRTLRRSLLGSPIPEPYWGEVQQALKVLQDNLRC
jgi:hypothetical protein